MLGIYQSKMNEKYIVTEYLSQGDLVKFLQIKKDQLKLLDFIIFCN